MSHNKTTHCVKCGRFIRNNNWNRHHLSCSGEKKKKIRGIDFDPNGGYKTGERVAWNKGLSKETDDRVKRNAEAIKTSAQIPGHGMCKDSELETLRRLKISKWAKSSGFGGYRENAGRSKKFKVFDSFGNQTTLQSSYELAVFEILCELGIEWIRPKALKYDGRNYFADFYLPTYNIWLDPKNDYKAKQDAEKIQRVIDQNRVNVIVLLKHQISKEHFGRLIYG